MGHGEIAGGLAHDRVEAGRASGHLTRRTRRGDTGTESTGDAVAGAGDNRDRAREPEASHQRGSHLADHAPRRVGFGKLPETKKYTSKLVRRNRELYIALEN